MTHDIAEGIFLKPILEFSISSNQNGEEILPIIAKKNKVFAGYCNGRIEMWDTENGKLEKVLDSHRSSITSLVLSKENGEHQLLFSGCCDGILKIWNVKTGELLKTIIDQSSGPVICIAQHKDLLVTISCQQTERSITNYWMSTRRLTRDGTQVTQDKRYTWPEYRISELVVDDKYITFHAASMIRNAGLKDGSIQVRLAESNHMIKTLPADTAHVYFEYQDGFLFITSLGYYLSIWDVVTGECRRKINHLPEEKNSCHTLKINSRFLLTHSWKNFQVKLFKISDLLDPTIPDHQLKETKLEDFPLLHLILDINEIQVIGCRVNGDERKICVYRFERTV